MRTIDIEKGLPDFDLLSKWIETEDVVFLRDGHAIARLEHFDDEAWEELRFEQSPEALEASRISREQVEQGEVRSLDEVKRVLGIE